MEAVLPGVGRLALQLWWLAPVLVMGGAGAFVARELRRRHMTRWMAPYLRDHARRRVPSAHQPIHVLLCVADHYEPKAYGASAAQAASRVERWVTDYPRQFGRFRDSDGRTPRHTFFYPAEEYEPAYLDALAGLCRAGFGEVEVHLHHKNDTSAGFREKVQGFRDVLVQRHGLLSRRPDGSVAYAFIHGNWALCNSRPDGGLCGVNDELAILHETGCYADLTFPSAPDVTQPPILNRIYYARDIPGRPRSHEVGHFLGSGPAPPGSVMMIEGPLVLDWRRRRWGLMPRLENGCLQASQPPSIDRLDAWLKACVQVSHRPDWFFVKLHAHGATEDAQAVLLGEPMVKFHEALAARARSDPNFHFHYVTAREMYNLAKAAEAGFQGPVVDALHYTLPSPFLLPEMNRAPRG